MTKPAIKIEHLSKSYELRHVKSEGIQSSIMLALKDVFGSRKVDMHHVLDDISLDIQKGEVLGIIGRNGSGKSTLLQILSNIIPPTSGSIEIEGTICSILGIGAGFHPDLTGRENVYLNGSLLGMSKQRIDLVFAEILEFSGIGEFIEEPVKNYSNGMYLRLAFSVFSHLDSDILLLDEVLAVGDAAFHEKTKAKITELARGGKTVVIVSHNPSEIIEFCTRCILIKDGIIAQVGEPKVVFVEYLKSVNNTNELALSAVNTYVQAKHIVFNANSENKLKNDFFELLSIRIKAKDKPIDDTMLISDTIEIEYLVEKKTNKGYLQLTSKIFDFFGTFITADSSSFREHADCSAQPKGIYSYSYSIRPYFFNSGIFKHTLNISKDKQPENIEFPFFLFEIKKDTWIESEPYSAITCPLLIHQQWVVKSVSSVN